MSNSFKSGNTVKHRTYYIELWIALIAIFSLSVAGCKRNSSELPELTGGTRVAQLTDAPIVPKRVEESGAQTVIVNITVHEVIKQIMPGVTYKFWTFGDDVPGPFVRVTQGDLVEVHLNNPAGSEMPHNLDFHAANGPGGGAVASTTAPGHTSVFSFRALTPGLFVYHCGTVPVPMHIANGMYGLIYVEPRDNPLPPVDHEFYIMQSEIYTTGNYGDTGLQQFSMSKALAEQPTYVVFNGSVGSTVGPTALKVKVGETIRLFVGNIGPNLSTSFHVIGSSFQNVNIEGGSLINHNVQTVAIAPGSATVAELKILVPGVYHIVDHAIFRAFNKGAMADIIATGPNDTTICSGQQSYENYTPGDTAKGGK